MEADINIHSNIHTAASKVPPSVAVDVMNVDNDKLDVCSKLQDAHLKITKLEKKIKNDQ